MFSLFFIVLTVSFLIIWFFKFHRRRKNNNSKQLKHRSNGKNIPITNDQNVSDLSKFQKWILDYSNTSDPNNLPKSLKSAYFSDDWHKLEPSDYAKWSKFHWGI